MRHDVDVAVDVLDDAGVANVVADVAAADVAAAAADAFVAAVGDVVAVVVVVVASQLVAVGSNFHETLPQLHYSKKLRHCYLIYAFQR